MTLLALTLAVGIVRRCHHVLENIFRLGREAGKDRRREALRSYAREIGLAVMATTLSAGDLFLPISVYERATRGSM